MASTLITVAPTGAETAKADCPALPTTLDDLKPEQGEIVARLVLAAAAYARREGFARDGYRVVINCNADGGQTVFQLHLHLLGGAPLGRFGTPKR